MAGWFVRARRGMSWKDETLDSMSAPPFPFMVFFLLLLLMVYMASNSEHKEEVERRRSGFRFSLLLLPMVVVVAVNMVMLRHRMLRYTFGAPRPVYDAVAEDSSSASGLLLILILLLVMMNSTACSPTGNCYYVASKNCGSACNTRCSLASRQERCKRACGTCCRRCNCVPPGTSGNQELCPCYYNMTTHGGRRKCP